MERLNSIGLFPASAVTLNPPSVLLNIGNLNRTEGFEQDWKLPGLLCSRSTAASFHWTIRLYSNRLSRRGPASRDGVLLPTSPALPGESGTTTIGMLNTNTLKRI